jgi:peptide/nickel transport system ATP-binding protein
LTLVDVAPAPALKPPAAPLLRIRDLQKHYNVRLGAFGDRAAVVHALDDFGLDILSGETLSLVGESGCGKSTAGLTILQLHRPSAGAVHFDGVDLCSLTEKQMRPYRRRLQIVFQDPYSSLNPRMTVGEVLAEPMEVHRNLRGDELRAEIDTLLVDVGLSAPFAKRYPHELSGGQRQRVAIARALACKPDFIVCDEAISALDVSVQAQIINLLQDLQERYNLTYLFIAHDLAVVRHISTRVAVMYLGRLAELAPKKVLFRQARHPYTQALLSAVPEADPVRERTRKRQILFGEVPSPLTPPSGCRFHTRCPMATDLCREKVPVWRAVGEDHWLACHHV